MPALPQTGHLGTWDRRRYFRRGELDALNSWWWIIDPTGTGPKIDRKFRGSVVTDLPNTNTRVYWIFGQSNTRTANPLSVSAFRAGGTATGYASASGQFVVDIDLDDLRAGRIPPVVRIQMEYLDAANDAVLATATIDYQIYDGVQRPQPLLFGSDNLFFDFNLETQYVLVNPGDTFTVDFNQRFVGRDGITRGIWSSSFNGAAWRLQILGADGQPTADRGAWQPYFRIKQFWQIGILDGATQRIMPLFRETSSSPGIRVDSAGHPFGQWQQSDLFYRYQLEIETYANVNFPENSVLRFSKRVHAINAPGEHGLVYKDFLVTTSADPRIEVPAVLAAFDGDNLFVDVAYAPIPPEANRTITMELQDPDGATLVSNKASITPSALDFTPANATTPQQTTLGIAGDASATLGTGIKIRYSDGTLSAETDVSINAPGETGASLSISPASVTLNHGGSRTIQASLNSDIGGVATIAVVSDNPNVSVRIPNASIPKGGGSVAIELSAVGDPSADYEATLTTTMTVGGTVRDTQTVLVRVRTTSTEAVIGPALPGHRYQINGVLQSTDDVESVSFEMDMAWAGESAFRDGAWRYLPGTIRQSVLTITPDMVIDVERCQIGPDSQDRINAATMQIAQDTSREYLPRRMAKLTLADALLLDGHEREIDMGSRAFINNRWQAARTLAVMMRRTRYDALYILRIRPGPNLERYHVHPGDIVTYTDARYNVYGSRCRVIASTINPDLSMTLSLRQEGAAVYQDAPEVNLPDLPPPVQLWTRLFQLPTGQSAAHIAAKGEGDGARLMLIRSPQALPFDEYNIDGSRVATTTSGTGGTGRTTYGGDYQGGAPVTVIGRAGTVFLRRFGGVETYSENNPGTINNVSFIANMTVHGSSLARIWDTNPVQAAELTSIAYGAWEQVDSGQSTPDPSAGERSLNVAQYANSLKDISYDPDGNLLALHDDLNFGPLVIAGAPSTRFTFQGQGDEHQLNSVSALGVSKDSGELYVIANVQVTAGANMNWVYRRLNITDPDEPR